MNIIKLGFSEVGELAETDTSFIYFTINYYSLCGYCL